MNQNATQEPPAPHPFQVWFRERGRPAIWLIILCLTAAATAVRFTLAIASDGLPGFGAFIAVTLMMICLFILEGMLMVMTQLSAAGMEGPNRYVDES